MYGCRGLLAHSHRLILAFVRLASSQDPSPMAGSVAATPKKCRTAAAVVVRELKDAAALKDAL